MKVTNRPLKQLAYGLVLAATLYNCKPKDVESLTPFTYTFKEFENIQLKEVTAVTPEPVVTKEAVITASAEAVAVNDALNSLSSGTPNAVLTKVINQVNQVMPAEKAQALAASLTPEALNELATTGTLPTTLQSDFSSLVGTKALQAYLPKYTMPEVGGKSVTARGSVPAVEAVEVARLTASVDACVNAAQASYNKSVQVLNDAKTKQTADVNAVYNQVISTINSSEPDCGRSVRAKYSALRGQIRESFNEAMADLRANRNGLGDNYAPLLVFLVSNYVETLSIYLRLELAELNSCRLSKDAKLAAAESARTRTLNEITSNFNSAVSQLNTILSRAIASCHNQGGGN